MPVGFVERHKGSVGFDAGYEAGDDVVAFVAGWWRWGGRAVWSVVVGLVVAAVVLVSVAIAVVVSAVASVTVAVPSVVAVVRGVPAIATVAATPPIIALTVAFAIVVPPVV